VLRFFGVGLVVCLWLSVGRLCALAAPNFEMRFDVEIYRS
jgi:hypothetical protein